MPRFIAATAFADRFHVRGIQVALLIACTAATGGCQLIANRSRPILGPNGGSIITLQGMPTPHAAVSQTRMDADLTVVRKRLDQLLRTGTAVQQGRDQIVVELPEIYDPQHVINLITKPGLLELVNTKNQSLPQGAEWIDQDTVVLPNNYRLHIPKEVVFTGQRPTKRRSHT